MELCDNSKRLVGVFRQLAQMAQMLDAGFAPVAGSGACPIRMVVPPRLPLEDDGNVHGGNATNQARTTWAWLGWGRRHLTAHPSQMARSCVRLLLIL